MQAGAAWVKVKVCPAMVKVPVRGLGEVFSATVYVTLPGPEPVFPKVIVIKAALLAAVHEQPAVVLTATLALPPLAGNAWLVGEIEYVQVAAAWVTVKVCPAMVSVPVRELVVVLAATE